MWRALRVEDKVFCWSEQLDWVEYKAGIDPKPGIFLLMNRNNETVFIFPSVFFSIVVDSLWCITLPMFFKSLEGIWQNPGPGVRSWWKWESIVKQHLFFRMANWIHDFSSPRKGVGQPVSPLRVSQAGAALLCEEEEDSMLGTRQSGKAPGTPRGRGRRGRPPSRSTGTRYCGKGML